jgi:hypothetical protein
MQYHPTSSDAEEVDDGIIDVTPSTESTATGTPNPSATIYPNPTPDPDPLPVPDPADNNGKKIPKK